MIKKEDIERAVRIFKEWDNKGRWDKPTELFIMHTEKKSLDSLNTAQALLNVISDAKLKERSLPGQDYDPSLWIINSSYYSMFFLAQVLLAYDNKKMPDGAQDTHKTTWFAILYYFIIKGSNLEGKKGIEWEDIKGSRLSNALILLQESQEESEKLMQIERAKQAVHDLKLEQEKRGKLTYRSTKEMELSHARTSLERAKNFRTIVLEYLAAIR